MLSEELKVKKFEDYRKKLSAYIGKEETEKLFEILGGNEKVMNAVYANTIDSGCAYDGSFIENVMKLTAYAIKYNDLLPENVKADKKSIAKVGLLGQIAKIIMFEPNDNSWEVTNRGIVYKYTELNGALRCGERSALIALNIGIRLTPLEYEAFKILDKNMEDDNYAKNFSSSLSVVIRQANETINIINRERNKK